MPPVTPDGPISFGMDAAKRIISVVKRVEAQPYSQPKDYKPRSISTAISVLEAVVTTAIPPFDSSTNTYGVGAAQVFIDNANGVAVPDISFGNTNSNSVTVLNWLVNTNTVAVGKHILIAPRNGNFRLVTGDC